MSSCMDLEEMATALQNRLNSIKEDLLKLPVVSLFSYPTMPVFFYSLLTNHTLSHPTDIFTVMNPDRGTMVTMVSAKPFKMNSCLYCYKSLKAYESA